MKKLKSTLPNMIVSLGAITILAGAALGGMYTLTKEPIERQQEEQQLKAIAEVAPRFDNNPKAEACTLDVSGTRCILFPARMEGRPVGAAVEARTMEGFGGEITVMVGFDREGTVTGYRVLSHAETPGLGSKMETWFRDPTGARSIIGRNPGRTKFRVSKDAGGEIDGITAATISSRAFLGAVRSAYEAWLSGSGQQTPRGSVDASTGATRQTSADTDASTGATRQASADTDASTGATKQTGHSNHKKQSRE